MVTQFMSILEIISFGPKMIFFVYKYIIHKILNLQITTLEMFNFTFAPTDYLRQMHLTSSIVLTKECDILLVQQVTLCLKYYVKIT